MNPQDYQEKRKLLRGRSKQRLSCDSLRNHSKVQRNGSTPTQRHLWSAPDPQGHAWLGTIWTVWTAILALPPARLRGAGSAACSTSTGSLTLSKELWFSIFKGSFQASSRLEYPLKVFCPLTYSSEEF